MIQQFHSDITAAEPDASAYAECASAVQQVLQSICDWQHSQPEMWGVPPGDQPVPWSWPMLCCVGTDIPMVLQVMLSCLYSTLLCTRELDEALTVAQVPPSWSFVSAAVTSRLQAVACMRLTGQAQSIVFWCDTNYVLYLSYHHAYTSWL